MKKFLLTFVIVLTHCVYAQTAEPVAPIHPVTEATLHKYFEVCHFALRNREALELQFAKEHKQMPLWFPDSVWNEIVETTEAIDITPVALPIYQRYWSEDLAQNVIRLFLTPEGQAMIGKVYKQTIEGESAGDPALVARRKALQAQASQEDASVHVMLNSLTPAERRSTEAFARSPEWQKANQLSSRLMTEFDAAYLAEQQKVFKAIDQAHHQEIQKAHDDYMSTHPDDTTEGHPTSK